MTRVPRSLTSSQLTPAAINTNSPSISSGAHPTQGANDFTSDTPTAPHINHNSIGLTRGVRTVAATAASVDTPTHAHIAIPSQ